MQAHQMLTPEEPPMPKPRKKKSLTQVAPEFEVQEEVKGMQERVHPSFKTQKTLKRSMKTEASPSFQQSEKSNSDSFLESSRSGNEYRALRHKYLLLEEESFLLGKELTEVESDVKTLEDEKLALLDQLVVLEGLIDPSELQPR